MQVQTLVGPQYSPDGSNPNLRGNREGAGVVTELHGKYYEAALRNQVFCSSTVIAGVALPVAAATLAGTFTIWNPASSGRYVELIEFSLGLDSATTVVNGIAMMIQKNLSTTSGIPTGLTAAYSASMGPGNVSPAAGVYTAATLTNVAIPGVTASTAVPIPIINLFSFGAVTDTGSWSEIYDFDGKIILPPDSLASFCTTKAAMTAAFCGLIWAEYVAP